LVSDPARGEIWRGEAPDAKSRPYLVLTRSEAVPVLRTVLVAPVTRTVRGIPTEVSLGSAEGLPTESVATMDNVLAFPKSMLTRRMGSLPPDRLEEMCQAIRSAVDC
jgi:mRNA interferase MazF